MSCFSIQPTCITRIKSFWKKAQFQVRAGPVKRAELMQGQKTQEHCSSTEWWRPPLWPSMQCTCICSSPCTQQSELGKQLHCIGGQRGGRHHSKAWNYGRTSDIFRAFVVLVRAKVHGFRQSVRAKTLLWCAYITGHEKAPVVYL